jgi:hypothetical protein
LPLQLSRPKFREAVGDKLAFKLGTLLSQDKYAIDPVASEGLGRYVASLPKRRIEEGQGQFDNFTDVLKKISDIVVDMVEKDFFDADQRVNLTLLNLDTWMHRMWNAKPQGNASWIL